jgi:hypothetical protein
MPNKKLTEADVIRQYKKEMGYGSDIETAESLKVSRAKLSHWLRSIHYPDLKWLLDTAREFRGQPQSKLAVELLKRRGFEHLVPCVCEFEIGDHGFCPRHGDPLVVILDETDAKKLLEKVKVT